MSTLREAAIGAMGALETARNGLAWYRDRYPESTDGSDDEAAGDIDAAIDALRAELVKPDAPTVEDEPAPQMPEALRDSLQRRCVEWGVYWRAPDAHGVDLTHEQALELLRDALGVEVEIAAAPRPAPAEPQPIAAWSIVRTAESAVVTAVRAALSAAPAPRPAGGEPVAALIRHRSLQTEARIAHDGCDHYSDWSDWEPATVQHALAVTDPARNTHPLLWEARLLVDCQPQPAAQQSKPLLEWQKAVMEAYGHLWHVNNEPAAPIPMRSPEKAAYEARKCLRELLTKEERGEAINAVGQLIGRGITATKGDNHA